MSGSAVSSVILRRVFFIGCCAGICALNLVASQSPQRIRSEIKDSERFALSGNVRPAIANAKDQGEVSGSLALPSMTMHFAMSASQKADLQQLLQQQQTRHSTQYHKWLTPEQYADRFGLNEKDMQKVKAWLESQGFTNVQAARGRSFITFSGTADQAQQAFHTSIHHYVTADGQTHYANATEPELPNALNGMVESIRGLHDFKMKTHLRPHLTSNLTGNHFLVPDDWATIYDVKPLYNSGFNGTGHSIVIPGQTDLVLSDIETFQTNTGQAVKDPQVIQVPTGLDPGVQAYSGDLGEADLDIEWAGGLAPGASIIFVKSQYVEDSESFAVDNNVADVLSITYGECEAQYGRAATLSLNTLFQQAASQGMSVVAASGDQGAADCDGGSTLSYATQGLSVDVPAALPYVTGVGGTEFNEGTTSGATSYWSNSNNSSSGSALSYFPEIGWNDSSEDEALSASGGGVSTIFAKPSWQTGTGVPNDGFRDVPDLALDSSADHDGYLTCTETQATANSALVPTCVNGLRGADPTAGCASEGYTSPCGSFNPSGGTSAAAPSLAAMIAILDQQNNSRQGFINPNLYTLASISSTAFHDITSGNNIVPCQGGSPNCSSTIATVLGTLGYSAGTGYDLVTGWGSIDAYNFVQQWNDDFQMTSSPTSLTINPSSSGTATINVSPHGSFTGTVTFTCSVASSLTATTCSVPGSVTGSGSVTLTVTAGAGARTPWWKRIPKLPNSSLPLLLASLLFAACVSFMTKQRKLQMAGFAFTVLFLAGGLTSCGGGGSSSTTTVTTGTGTTTSTSSVTGNVTVTGTSGSLTNSITVAVTIP
jgi:subtilase family serine protease